MTIVGVVESIKNLDLAEQDTVGTVYFFHRQAASRNFALAIRTERREEDLVGAVRGEILRPLRVVNTAVVPAGQSRQCSQLFIAVTQWLPSGT